MVWNQIITKINKTTSNYGKIKKLLNFSKFKKINQEFILQFILLKRIFLKNNIKSILKIALNLTV